MISIPYIAGALIPRLIRNDDSARALCMGFFLFVGDRHLLHCDTFLRHLFDGFVVI